MFIPVCAWGITDFCNWLYSFVAAFMNWLIGQISSPVLEQLNAINDAMPDLNQDYQLYLGPYLAFVNLWFPLGWAVTLVLSYIRITVAAMIIKWIMKFVPGF